MKKPIFSLVLVLAIALLSGCNKAKIEELEAKNSILREKQRQDSLYISDLTTEMDVIYNKLDSMRELESQIRQISADMRSGDVSDAGTLADNLSAIQAQLNDSRARIRELEARLATAAQENSSLSENVKRLEGIVVQLKKTIADKDQTIVDLQDQITQLQEEVSGLTVELGNEQQRADSLQTGLTETKLDLNTAYYVIGTNSELKKKDILVSRRRGFESDRNLKHFTKIDIRETDRITVGTDFKARKVDLVPPRPSRTYRLYKEGETVYLEIKDKEAFWRDKFLAIVPPSGLF